MGSDDGNKRSISSTSMLYSSTSDAITWIKTGMNARLYRVKMNRKKTSLYIFGSAITIYLLFLYTSRNTSIIKFFRIYISPEYHRMKTFQRITYMDYDYLPAHCRAVAKQFDACQDRQNVQYFGKRSRSYNPVTPIIVFACHRIWCHSYFGHCEPCSGLGDRYRFLIPQVETVFSATFNEMNDKANHPDRKTRTSAAEFTCYANVQIDAPTNGLQQIESSLYVDPASWFGELFHYRSYSVSKREPLRYKDILLKQSQHKKRHLYYYTHFTPRHYGISNDYNACFFHIIYKPDDQLQRDIQYHRNNILHSRLSSPNVDELQNDMYTTIGIVYHTDNSNGLVDTHNVMESDNHNQLISGWNQMYDCTVTFMKQLLLQQDNFDNVRLYLYTDSPIVIDHVRQHYGSAMNASSLTSSSREYPFVPVYVMGLENDTYLRGNKDDRSALLELYLLSGCEAIVVNALVTSVHNGTVAPINQLAALTKKIGFLPNSNFHKCTIH